MVDCHAMREAMPLLLTESLDHNHREITHQHIESCAECTAEWNNYKETWSLLGALPEVEVPARVREKFLDAIGAGKVPANVVPFRRRPAAKWLTQAAAVAILVGGSYYAGHRSRPITLSPNGPRIESILPVSYSIAETRDLQASAVSPHIQGRPDIHNVELVDADASDNKIGVSFDMTSHVTLTGSPREPSIVQLLAYVISNESSNVNPSRSRAIEWVKQTYSDPQNVTPEIAEALSKVLRNDSYQGVRISAVDTLKTLPGTVTADTRQALIDALKSDPNPSVRYKAIEALANITKNGGAMDPATLDTLRTKASQDGENLFIRRKAAEALKTISLQ